MTNFQKHKMIALCGVALTLLMALFAFGTTAQDNDQQAPQLKIGDSDMHLIIGWNLIAITNPMTGKNMEEIANRINQPERCVIPTAWTYNSSNQLNPWMLIQNSKGTFPEAIVDIDRFNNAHVGWGMWVQTTKNCTLGCGISSCR